MKYLTLLEMKNNILIKNNILCETKIYFARAF